MITIPFLIIAQNSSISGVVQNQTTHLPIGQVKITNQQTQQSAVTNSDGSFTMAIRENTIQSLEFRHLGYNTLLINVSPENTNKPLLVEMLVNPTQLSEVEVIGELETNNPFPVTIVDIKSIERSPQQDIGNFLRTQPNVGGIRKGAMGIDPVIRGFKYSQLNVQIDGGIKIEGGCPNRMDPATAHVDISDVQKMAIYKGPYALKYGPAFGGVIRLISNQPTFNAQYENHVDMLVGGQTNYEGYKTRINLYGGNQLIAYNFTTNWNKYGDYEAGNGETMQGSSNNYKVKGQIGFQPTSGQQFYVSYDRSWGKNIDFPTLPMDERSDNTEIYDFNYVGTSFGQALNYIKANIYNSDVQHVMDNKQRPFSDTVVAISDIHAVNTGGRISVNFNIGEGVFEAGSGYERILKDGNRYKNLIMQPNLPVFTEELWNNAIINNLGFFAEYNLEKEHFIWIVSTRLDLNQGDADPMIRYATNGEIVFEDANTRSNHTNFSFSGGFTWHASQHHDLGVSLGKGVRSPDMTERFITLLPVGYDNYDYLGNPQLKPESNHEIEFNWNYLNPRYGQFTTGLFFSFVTDYISAVIVPPSEVKPQTKGVLGVKRFINIDKAYLTGFEFMYSTPVNKKWEASLTAAYTAGINPKATKQIIENGQVTGEETINNDPLPEIPPFEANLAFNYHFLKGRLTPGFKLRMVSAQNQISEAYYETSTPGFTTLEILLSYQYNTQLTVYGGISNVFNTNYYEHLNRRIIGSSAPYLEPGRICYLNLIIKL
jgi:iron complex outermembrane receptor protein